MTQRVAVLVDGDNISGRHAAGILSAAKGEGEAAVVRAYLDSQRASDWHGVVGFRIVHAGTGKNAADLLLALDAIELTLSRGFDRFVIASSDGDFTHVAIRLRELGARVLGIGEAKAPRCFRASCTDFVELGAAPTVRLVPKPACRVTELDRRIRTMIAEQGDGTGMRLAALGAMMHRAHGTRISSCPERNWRAYLAARPALYDLDPRGPEARVRIRPEGFAQAA